MSLTNKMLVSLFAHKNYDEIIEDFFFFVSGLVLKIKCSGKMRNTMGNQLTI